MNSGFYLFAQLVQRLDETTKSSVKHQTLVQYFKEAPAKDAVWVVALFTGRRPKRLLPTKELQVLAAEQANIPEWLFLECYHAVGDLGETIALITQNTEHTENYAGDIDDILQELLRLQTTDVTVKKRFIERQWQLFSTQEKFVFNKLMSGSFRVGISRQTVVNALAEVMQQPSGEIAHKLMGHWNPAETSLQTLLQSDGNADYSKPYPFYLAYAVDKPVQELGDCQEWQAEYKWDGIRAQLIVRNNTLYIWSRGEELVTDKFPELHAAVNYLPDGTVLDGEIVTYKDGKPLPFQNLQTRISRKTVSKKQLLEAPVSLICYDILEWNGADIRNQPLAERRQLLENTLLNNLFDRLLISEKINLDSWEAAKVYQQNAREKMAEGLMLKRSNSAYLVGRKVGDWWKWKVNPYTVDAVMIYAQKGSGRRSNLYTDYTFAVKDGDKLVSFAKAYSGLTDKEFLEVNEFIKKHSIDKFGPVRTVEPKLVFEIAFEGIAESNRHKSGIAVRFPRMVRIRKDKTVDEINTTDDLRKLLTQHLV
jgi:DNA ligase 1